MYYITKLIQAAGLTLILIGFVQKFPELMNPRLLLWGIGMFITGWLIQKLLLKR